MDRIAAGADADPPRASDRVLAHLFFFFLVAQILSPSFFGVTVYLEVVIAVLTPGFRRWVGALRPSPAVVLMALALAVGLLLTSPPGVVELVGLAASVLYVVYCHQRSMFYLYRMLLISIGFAIAQAALLRVDRTLAFEIGPQSISQAVWGDHATATFSNFYILLGNVSRVSGLSREAGFFAALLVVSALIFYLDRSGHTTSKAVTLSTGWILSLSKISLTGPPLFVIVWLRRLIDGLPRFVPALVYFAAVDVVASHFADFLRLPGNETFLHRFGGNLVLPALDLHQLLLGVDIDTVRDPTAALISVTFDSAAGLSGFLIRYGLLVLLATFGLLAALGARATALLVVCIGTLNVDPLTSQNFVVLIYFVALYLLPLSAHRGGSRPGSVTSVERPRSSSAPAAAGRRPAPRRPRGPRPLREPRSEPSAPT